MFHILYTYCFNHVLNLCSVDKVKSVDNATFFFDLLQDLYAFISGSAVHVKFIEMQAMLYPKNSPLKSNVTLSGHVKLLPLKQFCLLFSYCPHSEMGL